MPSHDQVAPLDVRPRPRTSSKFCRLTLKDILSILVGITIPIAIGVYGAVNNEQAQKSAKIAADEQQRIAAERRTFDVQRATDLHQQQLYKDFIDAMYVFHKDGELNDPASPWAFANARYRAVHRDFDGLRKVQALLFLKEKQLIGRRTCITGCETKDVEDIIRLKGMSFDNLNLASETGGLNALDLSCIQFDGISMMNSSFSQANLNGVTFNNSRLNGSKFNDVSFNCADFGNAELGGASFVNTDLSRTKLTEAQLGQAYLKNVTMGNGTILTSETTTTTQSRSTTPASVTGMLTIPFDATWSQNGTTVAGRLVKPQGLLIDSNEAIVFADFDHHRIVEYEKGKTKGRVVAGGEGNGSELYQLNEPMNIVLDKVADNLIICDYGNRRVVQWSRHNDTEVGEILLDNIACFGLALDEQRNLYVSDKEKHEVRRYRLGEKNGTLVAGGNGAGSNLSQLWDPFNLFVDREQNVYVSDNNNHRVMKWNRNATEGIVVAGGQDRGDSPIQLSYPDGILVDNNGTLYVVENDNHRVTRWHQQATQGVLIAGGNGKGRGANQLNHPFGVAFDRQGNLYVADTSNGRVQRFEIQ